MTTLHVGHETATEMDHAAPDHRHVGIIGATGMSIHSSDGVALAAGLQVGGLGLVIAAVVVAPLQRRDRDRQLHAGQPHTDARDIPLGRHRGGRSRAGRGAGMLPHPGRGAGLDARGLRRLLPVHRRRRTAAGGARSDRSRWVALWTFAGVVAIYLFSIWAGWWETA